MMSGEKIPRGPCQQFKPRDQSLAWPGRRCKRKNRHAGGSLLPRTGGRDPRCVECLRMPRGATDRSPKGGVSWHGPQIARAEHLRLISPTTHRNFCVAIRNIARSFPRCSQRGWARDLCHPLSSGWRSPGASSFPFDPSRTAVQQPALWKDSWCAGVVIHLGVTVPLPAGDIIAEFREGRDRHLVLLAGGSRHRMVARQAESGCRQGYLLPADNCLRIRALAVSTLHEISTSSLAASPQPMPRPTDYQRYRLDLMLRLLDLRDDLSGPGLGMREIAATAFGGDVAGLRAIDWKTSSERRRLQRLLAAARYIAAGGYRDLLRYEMPGALAASSSDLVPGNKY